MKNKKILITLLISGVLFLSLFVILLITSCGGDHFEHTKQAQKMLDEYYNEKVDQFKKENIMARNVDVVFLGDSLTDGCDVSLYYPSYNALNRGIGGDTTFGVEKRLDVSVYDVNPKVVVMLIGANNMHTMFDNYEDILISFKENIPNTKIILLSLSSMGKDWARNNELAIENNVKIKALAEKYNYEFIDIFNPLLNPETNMIYDEYTTDGGHWTHEGYLIVTNLVNEKLRLLLNTK